MRVRTSSMYTVRHRSVQASLPVIVLVGAFALGPVLASLLSMSGNDTSSMRTTMLVT